MKKYAIILLLLISCNTEEDMPFPFFILDSNEEVTQPPIEQILDDYYVGVFGDSNSIGRTSETDGQPADLYANGQLSTVFDNAYNWSGSGWRPHQLNMNINGNNTGDNVGGWHSLHRLVYEVLKNNKSKKIHSIMHGMGSQGTIISNGKLGRNGTVTQKFIQEINQINHQLDVVFIELLVNDLTNDSDRNAMLLELKLNLEYYLVNFNSKKIVLLELGAFTTGAIGNRLDPARIAIADIVAQVNDSRLVIASFDPSSTYKSDRIHYDVNGTDRKGFVYYNSVNFSPSPQNTIPNAMGQPIITQQ